MDSPYPLNRRNLATLSATPVVHNGSDFSQAPRWQLQRVRTYLENINVGACPKQICSEVHLSERQNKHAEVVQAQSQCQTPYLTLTTLSFLTYIFLWAGWMLWYFITLWGFTIDIMCSFHAQLRYLKRVRKWKNWHVQALQTNRLCTPRHALEFHKVTPGVQPLFVINYYLQADQLKKKKTNMKIWVYI